MRGDPSFSRAVQEGLLAEVTAELRSAERGKTGSFRLCHSLSSQKPRLKVRRCFGVLTRHL